LGIPLYKCSRTVVYLDLNLPGSRRLPLKKRAQLEQQQLLEPDSTNVFQDGKIEVYAARPRSEMFEDMTIVEYFSRFRIGKRLSGRTTRGAWRNMTNRVVQEREDRTIPRWQLKDPVTHGESFFFQVCHLAQA
jgi:hypothetical protein